MAERRVILRAMDHSSAYQIGQIIGGLLGLFFLLAVPAGFIIGLIFLIKTRKAAWLFLVIPTGLLGLVFLGLVGAGVVMGLKRAKADAAASASGAPRGELVSTDHMIGITAPSHWKILTKVNDEAQLQAGAPYREEYLLISNELKSDLDLDLKGYAGLLVGHLKDVMTDAVVSEPEEVTINGLKALRFTAAGTIKGLKVDYLVTVVESQKHFHQLMMWTLRSKKDSAFPIFRDVAGSFKVVDENAGQAAASKE